MQAFFRAVAKVIHSIHAVFKNAPKTALRSAKGFVI